MPAPYFGEFLTTLHALVKDYVKFLDANDGDFLNIPNHPIRYKNISQWGI